MKRAWTTFLGLVAATAAGAAFDWTPVNIGTSPNDGTGDTLRAAFTKINDGLTGASNALATLNVWPAVYTNVLWVSGAQGNDSTAERNNPARPWSTITKAQADAQANDTIVVQPGTYAESVPVTNAVTFYFLRGANVSYMNSPTLEEFAPGAAWNYRILGEGNFATVSCVGDNPVYVEALAITNLLMSGGGHHYVKTRLLNTVGPPNTAHSNWYGNYTVLADSVGALGYYLLQFNSHVTGGVFTLNLKMRDAGQGVISTGGAGSGNLTNRLYLDFDRCDQGGTTSPPWTLKGNNWIQANIRRYRGRFHLNCANYPSTNDVVLNIGTLCSVNGTAYSQTALGSYTNRIWFDIGQTDVAPAGTGNSYLTGRWNVVSSPLLNNVVAW